MGGDFDTWGMAFAGARDSVGRSGLWAGFDSRVCDKV